MKKSIVVLFGFLLALSFPLLSFAQDSSTINKKPVQPSEDAEAGMESAPPPMPYRIIKDRLPSGQNHFYTVTLRGNGEALFSLRTVFSNGESASMSTVKFTFPNEPQNLSVYQAYSEPQCISYLPSPILPLAESDSELLYPYPYPPPKQECQQYQEFADYSYEYGWGTTTFHKAKLVLNGRDLIVELPKEVKPNGSGSLLFSFLMSNVTNKDFLGAYNFSVDTVRVADTIQNLQVGIMVDSDYFLKDAKGDINYQSKEAGLIAPSAVAVDEGRVAANAQFDQFYNSIGQGTIIKSVTNIQPQESYTVKGAYADSRWRLYGGEIGTGIGVVVLVLLLVCGSLFIAYKKIFGKRYNATDKPSTVTSTSYIAVFAASFGSSLLIFLYTIGLYLLSYYFLQIFQYYNYNFFYSLFIILLAVISLCIYAVFLFAPSVVIGIKKGVVAGSVTLALTIFWLVFFGVVAAGIFFLFFKDRQITLDYPVSYSSGAGIERSVEDQAKP